MTKPWEGYMKSVVKSLAVAAILSVPALGCNTKEEPVSVNQANNAFTLDVYKEIKGKEGNLFISPYSITSALTMTYAGANGVTAKEMADVLRLSKVEKPHVQFKELRKKLESAEGVSLHVANSLWPQKGYTFLKSFLTLSKENYDVDIEAVDFKKAAEKARVKINKWVAEKTMDKIPELINPGMLTSLTKMVLVNAIYFKGDWATPFSKNGTTTEVFYMADGAKVKTKLMYKSAKYNYKEVLGLQVIEFPYTDPNLSMVVLLPNKKDGIKALENELTSENITKWTENLSERKVDVHFPKFTLESDFLLGKTLQHMGMKTAFSGGLADFSKMDGKEKNLFIGDVIHKTFIAVDEKGTEAAGATAVVMRAYASKPVENPKFRADHPFLYLIKEKKSNTILFFGRFSEPTEVVSEEAK